MSKSATETLSAIVEREISFLFTELTGIGIHE